MFIVFSFVVPITVVVVLFLLWRMPLSMRRQTELLWVAEVGMCWSAMDVFIFSVVVALTEIQQFSAFIIKNPCGTAHFGDGVGSLDDLTAAFFDRHGIHGWEPTCLVVETQLYKGCYALAVAGVAHFVVSELFFFVAQRAVRERIDRRIRLKSRSTNDQQSLLLAGASELGLMGGGGDGRDGGGGGGGGGGDGGGGGGGLRRRPRTFSGNTAAASSSLVSSRNNDATTGALYAPLLLDDDDENNGNGLGDDTEEKWNGDENGDDDDDNDDDDEEGGDEDDEDDEEEQRRTTWGGLVGFHPMTEDDAQDGVSAGCAIS